MISPSAVGHDFQFGRNGFIDDERVITHGFEGEGISLKMSWPL